MIYLWWYLWGLIPVVVFFLWTIVAYGMPDEEESWGLILFTTMLSWLGFVGIVAAYTFCHLIPLYLEDLDKYKNGGKKIKRQ